MAADKDDNSSAPRPEKPLSRNLVTAEEFISSVAAKIAAQPLQYSDPEVWGVLTAISEKARKRNQVPFFTCLRYCVSVMG